MGSPSPEQPVPRARHTREATLQGPQGLGLGSGSLDIKEINRRKVFKRRLRAEELMLSICDVEKTESQLDSKKIKPVNFKGHQP